MAKTADTRKMWRTSNSTRSRKGATYFREKSRTSADFAGVAGISAWFAAPTSWPADDPAAAGEASIAAEREGSAGAEGLASGGVVAFRVTFGCTKRIGGAIDGAAATVTACAPCGAVATSTTSTSTVAGAVVSMIGIFITGYFFSMRLISTETGSMALVFWRPGTAWFRSAVEFSIGAAIGAPDW